MPGVNYVWDPISDNIVREVYDNGNVAADYTYEPGRHGNLISQHRDGKSYFYHYDGQGNTLALTDENGDVTDRYAFSAFGEVTEHSGPTVNPFQFGGQKGYYRDEVTGEYDVRQRQLCSGWGRWLSPDPLASFLSYLYARNNPTNRMDPTGLYDLDFSPTSEIGAPWCRVGRNERIPAPFPSTGPPKPADPNGLPFAVFGDTNPIKYDISCACICTKLHPIQYMIQCRIWAYLQIRIAPDNFIGNHTEKGVYGHEQRHVRNLLNAARGLAQTHVSNIEDDVYDTFGHCLEMKASLEAFAKGTMAQVLEAERKHEYGPLSEIEDEPIEGKDMPLLPNSKFPPKPDCSLPGKPKQPLNDQNCCEVFDRFGYNPVE